MTLRTLSLLAATLLLVAAPARADTDYHCLSLCVNSGVPGPNCMAQCSYNKTAKPIISSPSTSDALSKSRVLPTLRPLNGADIVPDKQAAPATHQVKDYKCVNLCLQQKMQYQTCNEQCTTLVTGTGESIPSKSDSAITTGNFKPSKDYGSAVE